MYTQLTLIVLSQQEQVEAARKGLDQAKEEGLKLHQSSDNDEDDSMHHTPEENSLARRTRRHREKGAPSTRVSGRLRGTPATMDDDMSAMHPSPDRERGRKGDTSANRAPGSNFSLKASQPKEVPERHRSVRGRAGNEDLASSTCTGEHLKPQTDQHISESERSRVPSQYHHPLSPVPSDAASSSVDRNSSRHTSPLTTILKSSGDEHVADRDTPTPQQIMRERRTSASSESICSPEHQSEQDGQHSLFPSLASPHSRSPRKRQSADEEVLKGLPEDSPSAKVLRKLPGRLVTVVEDKEPKRRKRGECSSGGMHTEGSSEETEQAESLQDAVLLSPNQSLNETCLLKSPALSPPEIQQGQEQVSPSSLTNTVKGYQPYSPTHHSSDMPVLRNLPVRRRLETESRMAAQLGEQFLGRGRGLDRRTPLSPKKQEPILSKDGSTTPIVATDASATYFTPAKRKRGRPPKMSIKSPEPPEQDIPVGQKSLSEEQSPPQSPKRKRGRPRKDSTTNAVDSGKPEKEASCTTILSSVTQEKVSVVNPNSDVTSLEPLIEPSVPEYPAINSVADSAPESFQTAVSPQSPKTDTQTTQFNTPQPQTPCEAKINQTSTPQLSSAQTNVMTSATISVSPDLSLSPLQVVQTENATQTNTKPLSLQRANIPCESFDSHAPSPVKECMTSSTPLVCQSSQVTTIPSHLLTVSGKAISSEISVKSNLCTAHPSVSTTPTELLAQPTLESNISATCPQLTSLSATSTSLAQTCEPLSDPIVKTGLHPPLSVPDLIQLPAQPDIPLENTLNPNKQTHATLSQPKPQSVQPALTHLGQIPIGSISSPISVTPNILEMASDSSQQSPDSRQKTTDTVIPVEEPCTENQQDPIVSKEDGFIESTVEMETDIFEMPENIERNNSKSQAKKRKLENLQEVPSCASPVISEIVMQTTSASDLADAPLEEGSQSMEPVSKSTSKKRNICRQSSQESVRSSSPSSVSSSGTLSTRSKNSAESSMAAKRKRMERDSQKGKEDKGSDQEPGKPESQCSNSTSSDSEDSTAQERRLTRSSHKSLEKETTSDMGEKNSNGRRRSEKKVAKELEFTAATPVRVTRKSIGTQPITKLTSPTSSEPEVLGKRCSALNAAAKLLAMRGKGPDPPSSSSKSKTTQGQQPSSEKINKCKGKNDQDFSKTNSFVNKTESSRQIATRIIDSAQSTTGSGHSASRSTRQRPGNLVPPLENEAKRGKKDEKKKTSDQKEEVEEENRETRSSRGHSACSSVSSERGAGSSRSRSSSNSSHCTRSLSSRSTGPPHSYSRAPSSGSDTEKGKGKQKKTRENRGRESRREKHSKKHQKPELGAGASEGTPDRVLRSVAALAAAQARTPASNTRSSSSQQRHSKT